MAIDKSYAQYTIDNGSKKWDITKYEDAGIEIWIENREDDKPVAIAFPIKGKNSIWYYGFRSKESMQKKIDGLIESRIKWKEEVKKRRAERYQPHNVKVGDVFYSSWGYDQTNIDWFQVDKLIGKNKITVVPLGSKFVGNTPEGFDDKVVPGGQSNRNDLIKGSKNYIVNMEGGRPSFSVNSFARAYPWDGTPKYETQAGYGH